MSDSFVPPPTIYDLITVVGVLLTVAILLYQWYLDNSAPLKMRVRFLPGVATYKMPINTFAHFGVKGKNRGRVPRQIRWQVEKRDPENVFPTQPGMAWRPGSWKQLLPHEEFDEIIGLQAAREGRASLRIIVDERGRWWRTHKGPWVEVVVEGWTQAVGGPSPYPPPTPESVRRL